MQVFGVGGANIDVHGQSAGPLRLRDSNPGSLHISAGGVTRNILENLARLGVETQLCSATGDDFFGQFLAENCKALSIGTEYLQKVAGGRTSSYLTVLDDGGDMLAAVSDMAILKTAGTGFVAAALPAINRSSLCVVDGNLPVEAMEYLCKNATVPLYFDPVSTAWAAQHRQFLPFFHTIKPNLMEAEVLAEMEITDGATLAAAAEKLLGLGVQEVYISLGEGGLYYRNRQGETLRCKAKATPPILNATGAGDATMAALVYGALHSMPPAQRLPFAVAASLAALAAKETINPEISTALVQRYIKEYVL